MQGVKSFENSVPKMRLVKFSIVFFIYCTCLPRITQGEFNNYPFLPHIYTSETMDDLLQLQWQRPFIINSLMIV